MRLYSVGCQVHFICMLKIIITFFLSILLTSPNVAQEEVENPGIPVEVGPWEGKAYHIVTKINKKFYDEVEEQEPFAEVKYNLLDIVDRDIREGFPQIDKTSSFGLILHSEIDVQESGTYGFTLSSDDGSKMWIGNIQVIDNDGPHGYKSKANRICLSAGKHPIKVWYYQGWPYRFGLELMTVRLTAECLDPLEPLVTVRDRKAEEKAKAIAEVNSFFQDPIPILFDHWKSDILPEYEVIIADIKSHVARLDNVIIRIEGHTDDTGSDALNMVLSRDRASAIMGAIYETAARNNNRIQSVGYGADRPVASNTDEAGRRLNRRVEVRIIPIEIKENMN